VNKVIFLLESLKIAHERFRPSHTWHTCLAEFCAHRWFPCGTMHSLANEISNTVVRLSVLPLYSTSMHKILSVWLCGTIIFKSWSRIGKVAIWHLAPRKREVVSGWKSYVPCSHSLTHAEGAHKAKVGRRMRNRFSSSIIQLHKRPISTLVKSTSGSAERSSEENLFPCHAGARGCLISKVGDQSVSAQLEHKGHSQCAKSK
jgi:hypothetical protein